MSGDKPKPSPLGNQSKWIGSLAGGAAGFLVAQVLPAALATPEVEAALTAIFAAIGTWVFPKNIPKPN